MFVGATNLEGDGQADLENHGGVDKAVLAYSADHYDKWRHELGMDMPHGAFGENLTIAGLNERSVHIGDVFGIGEARFEVSQPRQPCWKLARRWRMHELPGLVVQNGRSGWYLRVLKPGRIARQMPVTLLERPNPEWSIARANQILYHGRRRPGADSAPGRRTPAVGFVGGGIARARRVACAPNIGRQPLAAGYSSVRPAAAASEGPVLRTSSP